MPAVADSDVQADALQFLAQSMLSTNRGGKKHDTRIYWKRPMVDPATGKRDDAPGWIIWGSGDTQSTAFLDSMMIYSRTPLPQYGIVQQFTIEECIARINQGQLPPNHPDQYGQWGKILSHPKGPAEFPVDQILAFGWFDPNRCPVPGVKFPQLKGQTITVYDCPECNNVQYAKPVWLARHLRNSHDYDRQEIVALGEELGISFEKERAKGGRVEFTYDYDAAEFQKEIDRAAVAEIPSESAVPIERVQVSGRRAPKKEKRATGWTSERRKQASLAAKARMAAKRTEEMQAAAQE